MQPTQPCLCGVAIPPGPVISSKPGTYRLMGPVCTSLSFPGQSLALVWPLSSSPWRLLVCLLPRCLGCLCRRAPMPWWCTRWLPVSKHSSKPVQFRARGLPLLRPKAVRKATCGVGEHELHRTLLVGRCRGGCEVYGICGRGHGTRIVSI